MTAAKDRLPTWAHDSFWAPAALSIFAPLKGAEASDKVFDISVCSLLAAVCMKVNVVSLQMQTGVDPLSSFSVSQRELSTWDDRSADLMHSRWPVMALKMSV